jgi:hypothetical protein
MPYRTTLACVRLSSTAGTDAIRLCASFILSFHFDASIDATNWRAEQALRPAIVTRKVCGGNRSWNGADTHQILASVIRIMAQRQLNPHSVLASLRHARSLHVATELD